MGLYCKMRYFFVGLQFLTRLHIVRQTEWSNEAFGRSVKYFTLVGAVLGTALSLAAYLLYFILPLYGVWLPEAFAALLLVMLAIFLTGGLHCDGFMDTMDGIFSGRDRGRMLEIMKDSRVGANGVMGFVLLVAVKWSLIMGLPPEKLLVALFVMPLLGRLAMVFCITCFPYARPEGIGKAFAVFAGKRSLYFAALGALLPLAGAAFFLPQNTALACGFVALFAYYFARYVTTLLGGLTGDVYGAVTELSEALVLLLFLF